MEITYTRDILHPKTFSWAEVANNVSKDLDTIGDKLESIQGAMGEYLAGVFTRNVTVGDDMTLHFTDKSKLNFYSKV